MDARWHTVKPLCPKCDAQVDAYSVAFNHRSEFLILTQCKDCGILPNEKAVEDIIFYCWQKDAEIAGEKGELPMAAGIH